MSARYEQTAPLGSNLHIILRLSRPSALPSRGHTYSFLVTGKEDQWLTCGSVARVAKEISVKIDAPVPFGAGDLIRIAVAHTIAKWDEQIAREKSVRESIERKRLILIGVESTIAKATASADNLRAEIASLEADLPS